MVKTVPKLVDYKCSHCGFSGCKTEIDPVTGTPKTKKGTYQYAEYPTSTSFTEEVLEATTVSFVAASGSEPAKIQDSYPQLADIFLRGGASITIATTSGTNDGDYTIADRGISRSEIRLSSTDSLTTENAATAGTVTISRTLYKPNVTRGCPLCGSLNSRR